jgi:cyclase
VQDLKRAGRSDAEVRAAKVTAEFDVRFGSGFIKPEAFVQQVLGLLTR